MLNLNNKQNKQYEYILLKQKNVDTGMGLERITAVLQGVKSVYETDLFKTIVDNVKCQPRKLSGQPRKLSGSNLGEREIRIVADHVKAAVFIIADGIEPSNVDQGYVVRKLIRRAMRYQHDLLPVAKEVVKIYQGIYPEVSNRNILTVIKQEQEKFGETLEKGLKELNKLNFIGQAQRIIPNQKLKGFNRVDAKRAFYIYQSFGLPFELMQEELARKCLFIDKEEFNEELKKHQELSRTAAAGRFKAGLADHSEQTIRYHTATHLLLSSLRQTLGNHVKQAGSNITVERLRFDFTHKEKMTSEQITQAEKIVNEKIKAGLSISCAEMTLEQAEKQGALAAFKSRYPDNVRVYKIGNFSCEICSGPHSQNTNELGKFKIIKEESSSSGIRRIRAVLG